MAASNHKGYAEMEEISEENKDNLSTEAECLEMMEVASLHGDFLEEETANVLPSPDQLDLIASASCQDLEEDIS